MLETTDLPEPPPDSLEPSISEPQFSKPSLHAQELSQSPSMASLSSEKHNAVSSSESVTLFYKVLEQIIPEEFVEQPGKTKRLTIGQRLKKAGKSGWVVLRQVLSVVKEVSSPFPPLELTLKGLFAILEPLETMEDVDDTLIKLSKEICALWLLITPYHDHSGKLTDNVKARFDEIAKWLKHLEPWIKRKQSRAWYERCVFSKEDEKEVDEFLETLRLLIKMLELDAVLNTEYHTVQMSEKVNVIYEEKLLDPLQAVGKAIYEAQEGERCFDGTRKSVLGKLVAWCQDTEGPRIFWLSGMAGTGKSAVARTFCETLDRSSLLGGSFFCSRLGSDRRNDVSRIFPTLAHSLAHYDEGFKLKLLEALKEDSRIGDFALDRQLETLLVKTATDVFRRGRRMPVVVIDALDECANDKDTGRLLTVLLSKADALPFKFLVTSRPEDHVRQVFNLDSQNHVICSLHDAGSDMVEEDILRFIHHRLEQTQERDKSFSFSHNDVAALTEQAGQLFIYAFTACNYIDDDPLDGLERLRNHAATGLGKMGIDEMYTLVLKKALDGSKREDAIIDSTKNILAYLVTAQTTFPVSELAMLMGSATRHIRTSLKLLHSLVFVPESDDVETVSTLHASLGDYLGDQKRSGEYFVDQAHGHEMLADLCWKLLSELHFNIAGFSTSYERNEDHEHATISRPLAYACQYWVHHLTRTPNPLKHIDKIEKIFFPRFLFWLEVMSVEGKVDIVTDLLQELLPIVKKQPKMMAFVYDAIEFVTGGTEPIKTSVPHIYLSALGFCRAKSNIKKMFRSEYGGVARGELVGKRRSRSQHLTIKGHTSWVTSVGFSPDGTRIVSGSLDSTVRVWDAQTGKDVLPPLQGHTDYVTSVGFSPDGTRIVSGSDDSTVRVWDAQTGKDVLPPLRGHTWGVTSVGFSPDGMHIVSASNDKTVFLQDVQIANQTLPLLQSFTNWISFLDASPNHVSCKTLASRSHNVCSGNYQSTGCKSNTVDENHNVIGSSFNSFVDSSHLDIDHSSETLPTLQSSQTHPRFGRSQDRSGEELYDGWLLGPNDELLLWLPSDLRILWWPRTRMIIPASYALLDLSDLKHGHYWKDCNSPLLPSSSFDDNEQVAQSIQAKIYLNKASSFDSYMVIFFATSVLLVILAWVMAR